MARLTAWHERRSLRQTWNVGITQASVSELVAGTARPPCWLFDDEAGVFHADPFLLAWKGLVYLFCERFDRRVGRGIITCGELERADGGWRLAEERTALDDPRCHLSYPFLFQLDGEVFLVPEAAGRGRIDLYRARRLPDDWILETTLIRGFPGIDSTIFVAEGRFWLLTGRAGPRENADLYLFHAPALTGLWRPVGEGPVVRDPGCARMAGGVLRLGADLIRPGQDCRESYGRRVVLRRIRLLAADAYREETIGALVLQGMGSYIRGLHTLNVAAGLAAIDAKRFRGWWRAMGPIRAGVQHGLAHGR